MTANILMGSRLSIDTYPYVATYGFQEDHSSSYRVAKTCAFKSFFQVLGKLFQEGYLCGEIYSAAFLETDKGKQIPENGLEV
jgi:hypothetical protein